MVRKNVSTKGTTYFFKARELIFIIISYFNEMTSHIFLQMHEMSPEVVKRKIQICKQTYDVIEKFDLGLGCRKGELLIFFVNGELCTWFGMLEFCFFCFFLYKKIGQLTRSICSRSDLFDNNTE